MPLNPDQFSQLLAVLIKIADKRHAITEAADWPMLAAMVTMFGAIMVGLIAGMWHDLRSSFSDQKKYTERECEKIWAAMDDCQKDCCPPRQRK